MIAYSFCATSSIAINLLQVMAALIPKTQEYIKGKPRDAQCDAFVEHLILAFNAMKTKISKDVRSTSSCTYSNFFDGEVHLAHNSLVSITI